MSPSTNTATNSWSAADRRERSGDVPARRADSTSSLAVIASAAVVAIELPVADPPIGRATFVILRITWRTGSDAAHVH